MVPGLIPPAKLRDAIERQRDVSDHLVDMLATIIQPPVPSSLHPPGSVEAVKATRDQARRYAQRIWDEAWHSGALWGTARRPVQIEVSAERFAELRDQATGT